ncbi:hypothetical protein BFW01_g11587 [Lasiodiplodia theobromae]|nr:hypothetical protein BFW01_g11587 [Lasiodiplodia theobromae]
MFKHLGCPEYVEKDTLLKVSLQPSADFGHWVSKNTKLTSLAKVLITGQEAQVLPIERIALFRNPDPLLNMVWSALRTGEVHIWAVAPRNFLSWSRSMDAFKLSLGEPSSMWFYNQLPLVARNRPEKFQALLHRREELPIPPFLHIRPPAYEWHQCAQWWSPANPRVIYPTSSCFLNVQLPALLAEYSARSQRITQVYNLSVVHRGLIETGSEPNTVHVNITSGPSIAGYGLNTCLVIAGLHCTK